MSEKGIASRREADSLIERGLVLVDGKVVSELGVKVSPDAHITLAAEAMREQKQLVTIILNKPVGYVSGQPEPGYEPAIRLIKPETQWKEDRSSTLKMGQLKNIAVTGRLDIDSQGLLIFTQDGRLAKKIIGENSEIEKEYLVRVEYKGSKSAKDIFPEKFLKLLNHGLSLDEKPLKPAKVEWINEDQLRFILSEGKKRQIRRMCELVGLRVTGLKRVRVGRLKLGNLPEGQWRFFTDKDEI